MICDVKSKLILNALPYLGESADWNPHAKQLGLGDFFILLFYFISIFILLTRRKATVALIHRVGNYPDLLPYPCFYNPLSKFHSVAYQLDPPVVSTFFDVSFTFVQRYKNAPPPFIRYLLSSQESVEKLH